MSQMRRGRMTLELLILAAMLGLTAFIFATVALPPRWWGLLPALAWCTFALWQQSKANAFSPGSPGLFLAPALAGLAARSVHSRKVWVILYAVGLFGSFGLNQIFYEQARKRGGGATFDHVAPNLGTSK